MTRCRAKRPCRSIPQPTRLRTKAFPLPTTFRVGLAYDLLTGNSNQADVPVRLQPAEQQPGRVLGWHGVQSPRTSAGRPSRRRCAASYSYSAANNVKPATLPTALSDEENLQGLAAGGGLMYGSGNFNLSVDYAYKYMGILGATHFVSFGLGW